MVFQRMGSERGDERVALPVSRVYYVQVGAIDPKRHVLMKPVESYSALKGLWYPANAKLFGDNLRLTPDKIKILKETVGEQTAVLVGDSAEGGHRISLPGSIANEVITHMERKEEVLKKRGIPLQSDGQYRPLLDVSILFQNIPALRGVKGVPRWYDGQRDITIALAIDSSVPEVFEGKEMGRKFMANAIALCDELRFQQRYFFRNDNLVLYAFGETTENVTRNFQQRSSWTLGGLRNTTTCLNKLIDDAESRKGYTHMYLVTTGIDEERASIDTAMRIHPEQHQGTTHINAGLTQIIVGDHWKSERDKSGHLKADRLGQFPAVAKASGGDFYCLRGECADILASFVGDHYETFRTGKGKK